MKVNELFEEAKPAKRVPAGTFTDKKVADKGRDPESPGYDWRNPNHNPSGKKPETEGPHKMVGKYDKSKYPVLDDEFDTHLFDPELVAHLKHEYKSEWNKMTELEQIEAQIDFTGDSRNPAFGKNGEKFDEYIKKRALKLQKEIKRN